MEIQFDLTIDDIEAYSLYHRRHVVLPNNRNVVAKYIFAFLGVIWFFIGIDLWFSGHIISAIILYASILFVVIYISYLSSSSRNKKKIRKEIMRCYGNGRNDVLGKHDFSISPDGLKETFDLGQSNLKWKLIENIISTDKHIFLTMVGGLKAFIIPKTAFPDDTRMKQFIAQLEEYCPLQSMVNNRND